jgi:hypothetical protein
MISDFEILLSAGHMFVLSMASGRNTGQSHDDQKRWVLWLKENRDRMAASCRGVVSVVDAASDLALQQKQAAGIEAMIGIPVKLATNAEEADRIAAELLRKQGYAATPAI